MPVVRKSAGLLCLNLSQEKAKTTIIKLSRKTEEDGVKKDKERDKEKTKEKDKEKYKDKDKTKVSGTSYGITADVAVTVQSFITEY